MNTKLKFSLALVAHFLSITLLMVAVAASASAFFHPLASIIIAFLLAWCLGACLREVAEPSAKGTTRLGFGLLAWTLMSVTLGLSSAAIYERVTAQHSALRYLESQQTPLIRELSAVLNNAVTAKNAFEGWANHSKKMAEKEQSHGGSCPGRLSTGNAAGPVTAFRNNEATIASQLSNELAKSVGALESQVASLGTLRASDFQAVKLITAKLNGAVETAHPLTRGSAVSSARAGLERAFATTITWVDGKTKFSCADSARDEAMYRADAALKALQESPALKPVQIAIDLDDRQALATAGLQRAGNAALVIATLGRAGSFADDPLFLTAMKRNGVLNSESLSLWLGALLEISCAITAVFAARHSNSKAGVRSVADIVVAWDQRLQGDPGNHPLAQRMLAQTAVALVRLFYTEEKNGTHASVETIVVDEVSVRDASAQYRPVFAIKNHARTQLMDHDEPLSPDDEHQARQIAPYLMTLSDGKGYVFIPPHHVDQIANLAIDALWHRGAAKIVSPNAPYADLKSGPLVQRFVASKISGARDLAFRVFEIAPMFAQRLRLAALQQATKEGAA